MISSQTIFDYTNSYFLNGNVKTLELSGDYNKNFASSSPLTFNYVYDKSNRLLSSTINGGKSFELENSYDKDGNILTLDRYGSSANKIDDFNYVYYSGTNKLQRVSGSGTQYTYDANGNMTRDDLNSNYDIIYDHRNLILELKKLVIDIHGSRNDTTIYHTFYYYDEAGNRIRKMIYNNSNDSLLSDNIYSRDVSGRELAIYENGSTDQWNIYGMDNIGFIDGNEDIRFYMKDHLGSVRAVTDGSGNVISSQDYDAWGYLLENRVYDSDVSVYKFTSKERDEESFYDYFGARYYDARIGRWGQVEPLLDKYPSISSYVYSLDNPLRVIDPNGLDPFEIIVRTYIPTEYAFNFRGDNRGPEPYATSYRTEHIITVETNPNVSTNPLINDDKGKTGLTIGYFPDIEGNPTISTGKAEGEFFVDVIRGEENLGDNAILTISGSSTNPLIPLGLAPPIQYNFSIQIIPGAQGTIVKILGGGRTEYPSLEIYLEPKGGERQLIENYPATEGFFAPFDLNYKTYMNPLQEIIK